MTFFGIIASRHLQDGIIGPRQLQDGVFAKKIGVIAGSVTATNGLKSITGVGFKPSLVRFTSLMSPSNSAAGNAYGAATESDAYAVAYSTTSSGSWRYSSTNHCLAIVAASQTPAILASLASMDDDGFTLNVVSSSSYNDGVAYEAYH